MEVSISDAKHRLEQLIELTQAGEDVLLADRGKVVARLVPIVRTSLSPVGSAQAILAWLANNHLPAHARRSSEEIDAAIEEQRRSWS